MTTVNARTLWAWGANNCGQLGCGDKVDRLAPVSISESVPSVTDNAGADSRGALLRYQQLLSASQCGGGGAFSYVLTETGHIFACGKDDRGQLGLDILDQYESDQEADETKNCRRTEIENLKDKDKKRLRVDKLSFSACNLPNNAQVKQVAAGWDFMLALSGEGLIYSWGSNAFGQLGRSLQDGCKMDPSPLPVEHPTTERFVSIAAGLRHALAISVTGVVYAWGSGRRGQLGAVDELSNSVSYSSVPIQVPFLHDSTPVQVIAGMNFSIILTEQGSLYLFGCNKYGQCGIDPAITTVVKSPTRLELSKEETSPSAISTGRCDVSDDVPGGEIKIISLSVGWTHVVAKCNSGGLYSWGRCDLGQLGRNTEGSGSWHYRPCQVEGINGQIIMHRCSSEHTLAITEDGQLYSWGWNEHGICGNGNEINIFKPHLVTLPTQQRAVNIGCGAGHCFCVTSSI